MGRVQAKLVEEVAGDGDVRGVAARKRHRKHEAPKEEERAKKHKGDEPRKVKVVVVGGSKQKGGKVKEKGGKTKLVTWRRLSEELLEYLRTKEVMGFLATDTPRPLPSISDELFDQKLKEEIVAQFKENRGFDAYVLYQYRTMGYAEIQEEVAADDEMEKRRCKHKAPKEEERTKKHNGSKNKERTNKHKGSKNKERTNKHKGDEAMQLKLVLGDESKMGKMKKVRSPLPLDDVLLDEIRDLMAAEPLSAHIDAAFDEDGSASHYCKAMREFNASVLQQYRIKGCADLYIEVNDEEEVKDDKQASHDTLAPCYR